MYGVSNEAYDTLLSDMGWLVGSCGLVYLYGRFDGEVARDWEYDDRSESNCVLF